MSLGEIVAGFTIAITVGPKQHSKAGPGMPTITLHHRLDRQVGRRAQASNPIVFGASRWCPKMPLNILSRFSSRMDMGGRPMRNLTIENKRKISVQ